MIKISPENMCKIAGGVVLATTLMPADARAQIGVTELPARVGYDPRGEQKYLEGSARMIKPLGTGDIWLAQTQRMEAMGIQLDSSPETNPERAIVIAIGAAEPLDLDFRTAEKVYSWTGVEFTQSTGSAFVDDILAGGRVQVSRAQEAGNCVPTGCSPVRLVAALAHKVDGNVVFDIISDSLVEKSSTSVPQLSMTPTPAPTPAVFTATEDARFTMTLERYQTFVTPTADCVVGGDPNLSGGKWPDDLNSTGLFTFINQAGVRVEAVHGTVSIACDFQAALDAKLAREKYLDRVLGSFRVGNPNVKPDAIHYPGERQGVQPSFR